MLAGSIDPSTVGIMPLNPLRFKACISRLVVIWWRAAAVPMGSGLRSLFNITSGGAEPMSGSLANTGALPKAVTECVLPTLL